MFKKIKAINKVLVFRWVSILFVIVGICLTGYTIKAIFFKPDYEIKTEYDDDLNSEGHILSPDDPNESSSEIADTEENTESLEISYEARDYYESLGEIADDKEKTQFVGISYEEEDYVGELLIPSLDLELPIYEGTEKSELRKGVGRFIGSAQPGEADNCVLSGHRETVFSQLGNLELGETVIVKSELGLFSYEVDEIRIVDEDDRTVIVPYDEAILTLTTCYPFNGIGIAPERYIVSAKMTETKLAE
jgi:sortase A